MMTIFTKPSPLPSHLFCAPRLPASDNFLLFRLSSSFCYLSFGVEVLTIIGKIK